jgi:hypothetical protein
LIWNFFDCLFLYEVADCCRHQQFVFFGHVQSIVVHILGGPPMVSRMESECDPWPVTKSKGRDTVPRWTSVCGRFDRRLDDEDTIYDGFKYFALC